MKRALLLLVMVFAIGVPAVLPVRASEPGGDAIDEVAGCVRERGKLAVLILMDGSTSLNHNDEANNRVTAAKVAVNRLKASISAPDSPPVSVRMRLDVFDYDVEPGVWRDLATEENALKGDISAYAGRRKEDGTDYVKALNNATETLLRQVEESRTRNEEPPCQTLLWFTDGQFMPRAVVPTEKDSAGLCGADGVVTRLRSTGVTMLTVALTGEDPPDESLLRAITGLTSGCGANAARARGYYLSASDGPGLIEAFARIISGRMGTCDRDCRFVLEPPMRNAYVLIHTNGSGEPLSLVPPRGQSGVPLSNPGNIAEVAGAVVRWEWIGKNLVVVNADLAPGGAGRWTGQWRVDGRSVQSGGVFLTSNLEQRLAEEPVFLRGEPWRVRTEVLTAGKPFAPGTLDPLRQEIVVSVSDGTNTLTRTAQTAPALPSTSEVTFDAPPWRASEVTVKVELRVRTPSGIEINPAPLVHRVPVRAPLSVTPRTIHLSKRQGHEPVRGTFTVTADATPGCVWIDSDQISTSPSQVELVGEAAHDSAGSCLLVEAGRQKEVHFELNVSRGCRCLVEGKLPVVQEVAGKSVGVDVEFDFVSEANTRDLLFALAVLLLFTLVPLALMLFVNWWRVARFANPRTLTVLSLEVEVTPDEIRWSDRWEQGEYFPPSKPPYRRLSAPSVEFRTRTPVNPFKPPWAAVSATHGRVLATPDSDRPGPVVNGLPLDLADQVVVVADEERAYQRFVADVLIVLDGELLAPDHVARLRDLVDRATIRLRPPRPQDDQDP